MCRSEYLRIVQTDSVLPFSVHICVNVMKPFSVIPLGSAERPCSQSSSCHGVFGAAVSSERVSAAVAG